MGRIDENTLEKRFSYVKFDLKEAKR
jgi:hypothetical protein